MALKKKAVAEQKEVKELEIKVTRAHELEDCYMFDVEINGVMIYGCNYRVLSRKDGSGDFGKVNFPQRKGKDGKYYSIAYVKLSDEQVEEIERQIEAALK